MSAVAFSAVLLTAACGTSRVHTDGALPSTTSTLVTGSVPSITTVTDPPTSATPSATGTSAAPGPTSSATAGSTRTSNRPQPRSSATSGRTKSAAPHTPTAHAPTTAVLQSALLVASNLPGSYEAVQVTGGLDSFSLGKCSAISSDPAGVQAHASVLLTDRIAGKVVEESLSQIAAGDVAADMARLAGIPKSCATFKATISGFPATIHSAPLSIGPYGTRTVGVRFTVDVDDQGTTVTLHEDLAAVQYVHTIIMVVTSGISADTALTQKATATSYAKAHAKW